EVPADDALRRAGLLDLGDDRGLAGGDLRFDRGREAARWRRPGQARDDVRARGPCTALRDLIALAGEDARQHVRRLRRAHAAPSPPPGARVAATNASSLARAAPEAIVARASSTPLAIDSVTPATYSAAPA